MTIQVQTERDSLNAALDSLQKVVPEDARTVVLDEARKLARAIVNYTPPSPPEKGSRQRGELAIQKDLYSLISEAPQGLIDRVTAEHGTKNVDTWYTTREGYRKEIVWQNVATDAKDLPELHNFYRNSRGRVPRRRHPEHAWAARVVVPVGLRDRYVQQVQARLGRWKAKWALCGVRAAEKIGKHEGYPAWIKRHFEAVAGKSIFQVESETDTLEAITMGIQGPNARDNEHHIHGAIDKRTQAIRDRVAGILSHYSADWKRGVVGRHGKDSVGSGGEEQVE